MTALAVKRRYQRRVAAAVAVYLVSLFGANYLIGERQVSGALAWGIALLPGLAVAGLFYAIGMLIVEQKDEFQRMLLVRLNLIAAGFAMSMASIWGFLESFALVGHLNAYLIVVAWALGQALGAASNRLTHGTWGACW
jgi:hypothetical protein